MVRSSARNNVADKTKRERGVLAQREYRKRRTDAFKCLNDENKRLKDAIRNLSRAAPAPGSWGPGFDKALSEARTAAGLGEEREDENGGGEEGEEEEVEDVGEDGSGRDETSLTSTATQSPTPFARDIVTAINITDIPLPPNHIWLEVTTGPHSCEMPFYLGEAMYTFRAGLYWACMDHALHLFQRWKRTGSVKRVQDGDDDKEGKEDRYFKHPSYLADCEYLASLSELAASHRRAGCPPIGFKETQSKNTTQNTAAVSSPAMEKALEHKKKHGKLSPQWWKKAEEVEAYMREHLESDEISELQAIVAGEGSEDAVAAYADLMRSLSQNFVCVGEGPRWNILYISIQVGSWLEWKRAGNYNYARGPEMLANRLNKK